MSDPDGDLPAAADRADRLADAGEWEDLYRELRELDREALLSRPTLAYRFGEALFHTGRMEPLAGYAEAYERGARRRSDPAGLLRAINLAGISAFELGRTDAASSDFERLMDLAEAEGSTDMMARAANGLGSVAVLKGRHEEALSNFRLAEPLYERLGRVRGLAQLHHNTGICFRDLERFDDAVGSFRQASRLAESIDYGFLTGLSRAGRAEVELRRGRVDFGRQLAERGLEEIRDVGDPISEAEALRVLGLARAATPPERGAGVDDLREALRLARDTGSTLLEGEIERDLAGLLLETGRAEELGEGRRRLERAVELFERVGADAYAAASRRELASLDGGDGERPGTDPG